MRVTRLAVVLVAVATALAAATAVGAGTSEVDRVGFAAPEKPTDYGWNQQGFQNAKKAANSVGATFDALTGIGYENVEPNLRRLAERGADLIIAQASGYQTSAVKVAQQFDVPVLVYDNPKAKLPGLVGDVETTSQQGAFLAGVLAAQVTKVDKLGIVISAEDTNWYKQSGGFIQGARSVNPDIEFVFARIGAADYADRAGGRRTTQSVIAAGVDIVFGMGDGSSFGMKDAVETATPPAGADKVWFIDVIGDKSKIDKKDILLSSVIWDFTKVFQAAIRDINAGNFGKLNYFLTVRNGISLLRTDNAPDAVWNRVARARADILSGKTKIRLTPTEKSVKDLCGC